MGGLNGQRALAYIRVSVVGGRAKRGRFDSPELQRHAIDGVCADLGVTVAREVRDLNRSGGTLTRPGLAEALELIQAGEVEGIVVARSDRASRRTLDGLGLIETLAQMGAWIIAADGTIDTTTRIGRLATTMNFAIGQNEYERYKEQSEITHRRAILDKGRHMGPAPFGYVRHDDTNRLIPDRERAPWVRHVFQRRAEGAGWAQIARELDEAGVRHAGDPGRRVTAAQLGRLVRRRVYLGEAHHREWVSPGAHPALVDEAMFAAANRARPTVAADPFNGRRYPVSPLRGLLRCAGCRYAMKRLPAGRHKPPRWACRQLATGQGLGHVCEAPARVKGSELEEVERLVLDGFLALCDGDHGWSEVDEQASVSELQRAVLDAEALMDELASLEQRRALGAQRWGRMVEEARRGLEEAQEALTRAQAKVRPTGSSAQAREVWELATEEERGELLRSMVQAVMVVAGDDRPIRERVHVLPVWESVDLPRKGVHGYVVRPWDPDAATGAS